MAHEAQRIELWWLCLRAADLSLASMEEKTESELLAMREALQEHAFNASVRANSHQLSKHLSNQIIAWEIRGLQMFAILKQHLVINLITASVCQCVLFVNSASAPGRPQERCSGGVFSRLANAEMVVYTAGWPMQRWALWALEENGALYHMNLLTSVGKQKLGVYSIPSAVVKVPVGYSSYMAMLGILGNQEWSTGSKKNFRTSKNINSLIYATKVAW